MLAEIFKVQYFVPVRIVCQSGQSNNHGGSCSSLCIAFGYVHLTSYFDLVTIIITGGYIIIRFDHKNRRRKRMEHCASLNEGADEG